MKIALDPYMIRHLSLPELCRATASGATSSTPPCSTQVRVHQHLDMGQGAIDCTLFFQTLGEEGFDGVMSSCVFT